MTRAAAPGVAFWLYAGLTVAGAVLPLWQFVPWLVEHGLRLFADELFANRISSFFGFDVIVLAVVLLVFMQVEAARRTVPYRWVAVLTTLTIGVSCGLPLFLALRERARA